MRLSELIQTDESTHASTSPIDGLSPTDGFLQISACKQLWIEVLTLAIEDLQRLTRKAESNPQIMNNAAFRAEYREIVDWFRSESCEEGSFSWICLHVLDFEQDYAMRIINDRMEYNKKMTCIRKMTESHKERHLYQTQENMRKIVVNAIRIKWLNLKKYSQHIGIPASSVSEIISGRRMSEAANNVRVELSEIVGIPARNIWPDCYTEDGRPLICDRTLPNEKRITAGR